MKTKGPKPGGEGLPGDPLAAASGAQFSQPMLAEGAEAGTAGTAGPLSARPGGWLYEPKLDGLRCVAVRNGDEVTLYSRNRLPLNARFPALVRAVGSLPASGFVLDGEIVGLVEGRPDFGALQQGSAGVMAYWVFDLMYLLGRDVRHLPIEERKSLLAKLVVPGAGLGVVRPLEGDPRGLYESSCREGWEGLVAKKAGSTYREGRSAEWVKLKCHCRQELVIGGFTPPRGARQGLGALLVGYWEPERLVYAGKVGTGFDRRTLADLTERLVSIQRLSSPFGDRVVEKTACWVEPELVAEVAFTNWTADGRLRHPSFLGLRNDKAARDVVREACGPMARLRRRV